MFPEGYKVLAPPAGYMPIRTPARKITATPTPMAGSTGFHIQVEDKAMKGNKPECILAVDCLPQAFID